MPLFINELGGAAAQGSPVNGVSYPAISLPPSRAARLARWRESAFAKPRICVVQLPLKFARSLCVATRDVFPAVEGNVYVRTRQPAFFAKFLREKC